MNNYKIYKGLVKLPRVYKVDGELIRVDRSGQLMNGEYRGQHILRVYPDAEVVSFR